MESKTLEDLVEGNKMYQLVTERLEVKNPSSTDLFARFDMEAELMALILDLYNEDDTDFPYEKLQNFPPDQVLSYLQASHKLYLSKKLPEIELTMEHFFSRYGESHPLLTSLTLFFNQYKNRLVAHIRMEEKEFFPFIKRLIAASKGELTPEEINEIIKTKSIDDFNDHHDPIEDDLKEVSALIHTYSSKEETPLPFRVFLNQVELFELELRKHAIIEDHVLVPIAKELERALKQK
jgi:regulator of cell morphogenesis and NO signaling